ncbi:hypothetical protein PC129_g13855 [Phytophthora cactorum]|uniref:Reverse transcriptase RNase H-like domain-containing protein n=1 Tax=Phytophthora cactorum TaxID=29920 RepID=A0A329S3B1_9STRA|nr:hypothetical protein Pcac1_g6473 [Phytophthora cactorum]KAG2840165.1 hypothetical protein PC112_g3823 [Phytophthora cactorum]KAG2846643.1 hypothetical protein PC111_g1094 [Phytophthora cactorum]KAG2851829.1 hypothetical protein PC113_g15557 [Phytophthora cactorum]KAG2890975.1 hypothetical protein PC114_g17178 [Phytophthora cactorum]
MEVFPIAFACDKLDRLQGFRMFCDHLILIHVFASDQSIKKHVEEKLLRWSMKIMNYNYTIEHITQPQNVWADMISRWAANHAPTTTTVRRIRADTPVSVRQAPLTEAMKPIISTFRSLDDDNFVWSTIAEIT